MVMFGLIGYKIWGIDIISGSEIGSILFYNHSNGSLANSGIFMSKVLLYTGIFLLTVILLNSIYLIGLDSYNYFRNRYKLDDPKIRVHLLIDTINSSLDACYFLQELRTGYFRLATRDKNRPGYNTTVLDGSITSIQNHLNRFFLESVKHENNGRLLYNYNSKCLELCDIKHINLVKRRLFT